jgi:serine/threonine protein kinase
MSQYGTIHRMVQSDNIIGQRYKIDQLLGRGGMGSVYAAYDQRLGRQVALKLLRPDLAAGPKARQRFLSEAQIAAQLVHPHIVRTYDVGDSPEGPYLVQELLNGRTLSTLLLLSPERAIKYVSQVASALDYIHSQGYVHCDVKPENIMVVTDRGEERVVLLDFGIARAQGTDTTTLLATPHYLAPERAQGTAPTPASDLYALGVVLYQSITGKLPFDGTNQHAIIHQHLHAPLPSLQIESPYRAALDVIIHKLIAKQPEARYASAAELHADLLAVLSGARHAQPTAVVAHPSANPFPQVETAKQVTIAQQQRTGRWMLGLPLLLALGLVFIFAWRLEPNVSPITQNRDSVIAPSNSGNSVVTPTDQATNLVSVPNVIGVSVEEARAQIEQAGLVFINGGSLPSDQPAGIVLSSEPGSGQLLASGSQVTVQVSTGPQPTPTDQSVLSHGPDDEINEEDEQDENTQDTEDRVEQDNTEQDGNVDQGEGTDGEGKDSGNDKNKDGDQANGNRGKNRNEGKKDNKGKHDKDK